MISKKVLIPMAAVVGISAGAFGLGQVSAATSPTGTQSLVQKLAATFHLDPAKVQAVFTQNHEANQASAEARYEQSLSTAVANGQLTATQKDSILAEHNKLTSELQAAVTGPAADRHAAQTQVRTEATAWATANNVAVKWLLAPRRLRGMGPGKMHSPAAAQTQTPSPSPVSSL